MDTERHFMEIVWVFFECVFGTHPAEILIKIKYNFKIAEKRFTKIKAFYWTLPKREILKIFQTKSPIKLQLNTQSCFQLITKSSFCSNKNCKLLLIEPRTSLVQSKSWSILQISSFCFDVNQTIFHISRFSREWNWTFTLKCSAKLHKTRT